MPFTPFHMGPGIVVKALLQGSFSLMVFGWAQIVMDIQPLFVLISGEGHLHGGRKGVGEGRSVWGGVR